MAVVVIQLAADPGPNVLPPPGCDAHSHRGRAGMYLADYDPEYAGGTGLARWTDDLTDAMRFGSVVDAFTTWRYQSQSRPLRGDGKPNRPLTAYTCTFPAIA